MDNARVGVCFHGRGERDNGMAGHQTVGVEHHHMLVVAAPAGDEILDIAGLSIEVPGPVPVEQAAAWAKPFPHGKESLFLGDENFRISRVGEKKPFERAAETARLDLLEHRRDRAKDARRRLIVDWHDDRRALTQRNRRQGWLRREKQEPDKARQGAGAGERDPGKIGDEEKKKRPFEGRHATNLDYLVHFVGAVDSQAEAAAKHKEPREPAAENRMAGDVPMPLGPAEPGQPLRRHREWRFGRHAGEGVGRERTLSGAQRPHHRLGWL